MVITASPKTHIAELKGYKSDIHFQVNYKGRAPNPIFCKIFKPRFCRHYLIYCKVYLNLIQYFL